MVQEERPLRVLLVTATAGFHHSSIATAQEVVPRLGAEQGGYVTTLVREAEDVGAITAERLAETDVVFLANTSGELPLDEGQKRALAAFVANGGGFVGTHSATDTFYEWPEYGRLVGAYFKEHPWTQEVRVAVEDTGHPIVQGLGLSDGFVAMEEVYTFRTDVRANVQVLLSLDVASVGLRPGSADHPLAWVSPFGAGRAFYLALGHFDEMWEDARFQGLLVNGIRWAGGRL
jgi:type 1 glutamine amidotransferase